MILTIGMIVKNEEKWLDKCLSAIKPILDNVDSELIITDTGSTDKTVEIAKKYTEKVLHFDWINDFSAARNFGLENARGEWFMYLDADDIFESCDEIIKFFNTGEYKKFNSASYVGKNLVDNDGHYALNKQPRLTKILKETRFKNVVHEVFTTYGAPKKDIKDVAVHYGYLFENDDQKQRKKERNRELLLKKLEKEKNSSAFVYVQLAENENDISAALKFVEEGITVAHRLRDISMIPLMKIKANLYLVDERYDDSLKVCNEYFRLDKVFRPGCITADAEILAIKAWDLYCLKRYDLAVETYVRFFDVYEKVRNGELNTAESDILMIQVASQSNYLSHVTQFLSAAAETKQYSLAADFIKKLNVNEYLEGSSHTDRLIDAELRILAYLGFSGLYDLMQKYDSGTRDLFAKKLGQMLFYTDDKNEVINTLNRYPEYSEKAEIYEHFFGNLELTKEMLNNFARKNCLNDNPDILMIAMYKQYDISGMLSQKSCDIRKLAQDGYKYYYGFNKAADNYNIDDIEDTGILARAAEFFEDCMYCTPGFTSPKPKVFVVISANRLLENFGKIGLRIEKESGDMSDERIKAAVLIGHAVEARKKKAYRECISAMKNAISVYNPLARFIQDYCNEVIDEYGSESKASSQEDNEMQRLAAVIKNKIRGYIISGDTALAQKTLSEYKSIVPGDPDIDILRKEISDKI